MHHGWLVDPGGLWAKSEGLWIKRNRIVQLLS